MGIPQRQLGETGPLISVIGLGCNNFGRKRTVTETVDGTRAVLDAALASGVNFLDTAEMYGATPGDSEALMGEALAGHPRDSYVLATKWGHPAAPIAGSESWGPRGSRTHVRNAVEGSLRRLRTDYIDLYQFHRPDPDVDIADTLEALGELIDEGKVLHIGHTTFSGEQIVEANEIAESHGLRPFISSQNDYSLLSRDAEDDVLPEVARAGMGFLPFFPLANGLLTGKYTATDRPADSRLVKIKPELLDATDWQQLAAYQRVCDDAGLSMLQATFGWLLSHNVLTSVIAGATSPAQVAANANAGSIELSQDVVAAIDAVFARN